MGLTIDTKNEIGTCSIACKPVRSQSASASLKNVSVSTINSMSTNVTRTYPNAPWRSVRSQISGPQPGWVIVDTKATEDILFAMNDAREDVA